MQPAFLPSLANGPRGDPALYVHLRHTRRALLFDLGDIPHLGPRQLLALDHVFVSHAHMDHFAGFDRLLRVVLGRERTIGLFGPEGFSDRVAAKLGGYTWNLAAGYRNHLQFEVTEVPAGRRARFRVQTGFAREDLEAAPGELLVAEPGLRVRATVLDHRTPCLAFALEEPEHLAIWPDRLQAQGLAPGDWLASLKEAVRAGAPDDTPLPVAWREPRGKPATRPLGELRDALLSRGRGQKLAYVVDAGYSEANARRIVELAAGADRLYIEAAFLDADAERAAATFHLTARQAGELARRAGVREVIPFHFSSRYQGRFAALEAEARAAFGARD
ncbi:MAG TPA: MBL fold metallo-hydrolase [Gammaproteobacteria bacterium]|nr:MBL fold metallo-hydrolase [Gammaproteobacteria bacterium]